MQKAPVCKENIIDEKKVNKVKNSLPESETIFDLSETFKTLSDSTRLKIVLALSKDELCVCDLSTVIGVSISAVSHQLRILRNSRLVKYRKEGKMVYYSLDDKHINKIVTEAKNHVKELYG